jgi:putative CocE/NonD family hydrolase
MAASRSCPTWPRLVPWLLAAFAQALAGGAAIRADAPPTAPRSEPTNEVVVRKNVKVAARDGTRLAADIYLPARGGDPLAGRFATILARTPYNKDGMKGDADWFAARGYAVVINDVRGRYESEGTWRMIVDDPADGFDVVHWITEQPWSNGRIGTIGTSYVGGTQHALAIAHPPGLAAMIPVDSLSNCGIAGIRHGGAFELRFMNWIFTIGAPNARAALANEPLRAALVENGKLMPQHLMSLPIRKGCTPLRVVPEYEDWLIEVMRHADYDDYWKQSGYSVTEHVAEYADVPVYHVTGWYDSWCRQNTLNYQALSRTKKGPHRLIIGPWTHGAQASAWAGAIEFPPEAALDLGNWRLAWFERWLRDGGDPSEPTPPVKIFVMGGGDGHKTPAGRRFHGGHWRDEKEFPLARSRFTPYYLHGDGTLGPRRPDERAARTSFRFDPLHPVPTLGGNLSSTSGIADAGGFDQRARAATIAGENLLPLSERRDVLVFQTDPLQQDVEVTGPVAVRLWISSSASDTDFTAKLVDVYPPNEDYPEGYDLLLCDSIIRCRYRNGFEREELMEPGAEYDVSILLPPTSNLFAAGHRIRVDVSSSNFPRLDRNPNTGEPMGRHTHEVVAENSVHGGSVVLPVILA